MAITKSISKIFEHGGGVILMCRVNADGSLFTGAHFSELGYIEKFGLKDETPQEVISDETGDTIKYSPGVRTCVATATLMQVNKDTIDAFTPDIVGNRYYSVYTLRTKDVNPEGDVNLEIIFPVCQIKPMVSMEYPKPRLPIEINCLKLPTSVSVTSAWFSGYTPHVTLPVTIAAGKFYDTFETAIS